MNLAPMDVRFDSVSFSENSWHSGKQINHKDILKNISGKFRSCELTAVIGQSGSGKTTLLNVLSGYTKNISSGRVAFGDVENRFDIAKSSKFIMQNYSLHRFITVREAMSFAANLKLHGVSNTCKNYKIDSILDDLGLSEKYNCFAGDLSGGEQKRLSIALEIIDNPPILFLDEPTTGLDSSASIQCMTLLKKLAREDRTIICTVHTPSALLLENFDHLYVLADGSCIYQGSVGKLVPFLKDLGLNCPSSYNPADFLIEIANNDYGIQNERLTEKVGNGRNESFRTILRQTPQCNKSLDLLLDCNQITEIPTNFFDQLFQLLHRNFLIQTRDKCLISMRLTIHFVIALFIGIMYAGIGNDGASIYNIYKFLFFNIFLMMFTAFSSLQTSFPLDLPMIRREHFNGWYSTLAYYFALTVIDIPIIFLTTLIYVSITYFLTNQPMELYRFGAYYITILLLSFAAQGLGLISGSITNVKFTLILGSFFICPFVLFSNFFIQLKDTSVFFHWIFETSFIKHALTGSLVAIFGFERQKMDCLAKICHYTLPQKFLESLEISDDYTNVLIKLSCFVVIFHTVAFFIIRCRLKH